MKRTLSSFAPLLLLASSVDAALVTLSPIADATIYGEGTDQANGRGIGLIAGNNANSISATRRALLRFDLSAIPADASIQMVQLRLYLERENTGLPPLQMSLHRLTRSWTEGATAPSANGGGGAPAGPGDVTWLAASLPGQLWVNPGGDFTAAASAVTPVGAAGQSYFWEGPGLVSDVQSAVLSPENHHGWVLLGDESQTRTAKLFSSREATDPTRRPELTVFYTVVVPEPSVLGLLVPLVAAGGLRRR
jgi:hypothetical protein